MSFKTYTTHEIAKFCDVYPSSVLHWINEGKLRAHVTPGGHRRVAREELIRFLKQFQMPIPAELRAGRRRVLIVDDEPEMARMLEKIFRMHAEVFDVEASSSGIDALIKIGQSPPDLVVLDVVMPKMDGFQVCQILKTRPETRYVRIIALTGKKVPINEHKLDEHHIDAFFRKPFDVGQLLAKAARLLGVTLAAAPDAP